jgi:hypothetical protein
MYEAYIHFELPLGGCVREVCSRYLTLASKDREVHRFIGMLTLADC